MVITCLAFFAFCHGSLVMFNDFISSFCQVDLVPPPPVNSKLPGVTTSLLYSGSKFRGHQKSKGNSYDVEVVLQNVDEENSYLCGYLKVLGCWENLALLICH